MESQLTHHIARETLLELGRTGTAIEYVMVVSDDGLALQAKTGYHDAVARSLGWLGVGNAQLKLGPWRPRSTACP
jgi:beta-lactamase class D